MRQWLRGLLWRNFVGNKLYFLWLFFLNYRFGKSLYSNILEYYAISALFSNLFEYGHANKLLKLKDNHKKIVISLDDIRFDNKDGIIHLRPWELNKYLN